MLAGDFFFKVQLFWEGHKNLRNLPHGFDVYQVNVKTMKNITQIFVPFSKKLNFDLLRQNIDFFRLFIRKNIQIRNLFPSCQLSIWSCPLDPTMIRNFTYFFTNQKKQQKQIYILDLIWFFQKFIKRDSDFIIGSAPYL